MRQLLIRIVVGLVIYEKFGCHLFSQIRYRWHMCRCTCLRVLTFIRYDRTSNGGIQVIPVNMFENYGTFITTSTTKKLDRIVQKYAIRYVKHLEKVLCIGFFRRFFEIVIIGVCIKVMTYVMMFSLFSFPSTSFVSFIWTFYLC